MRKLLLFVLALVAGCSRQNESKETTPTASVTPVTPAVPASSPPTSESAVAAAAPPARAGCDGVFDPPAGATKLCDQHTLGNNMEIHWTSWTVKTSPWETFEPYRKRAGECKMGFTFKPPILSVSDNADMRLSIHDVKETGIPSCEKKPDGEAKAIIVISRKHDR